MDELVLDAMLFQFTKGAFQALGREGHMIEDAAAGFRQRAAGDDVEQGDVLDVTGPGPYGQDASVDTIVCTLVLCSVPDPLGMLKDMRRVLRPGGQLLFLEHVLASVTGKPVEYGAAVRAAQEVYARASEKHQPVGA